MSLLIVQLSDFHLTTPLESNPLLGRLSFICGALRSELEPGDECILIYCGDIAYHGKAEEYDIAFQFMMDIHSALLEHTGKVPIHVVIPGNHDLDFDYPEYDETIRENLIDTHGPKNPLTQGMEDYCLKPQQPFRDFIAKIKQKLNAIASSDLIEQFELNNFITRIKLNLINTTRLSKIHETPGVLWLPLSSLSDKLKLGFEKETVSITILHHPYNWHQPDNASEIKKILEANSDIIFSGHEHNPDIYQKKRRNIERNLYLEGGVLQESEDPDNSCLNVIRVNLDEKIYKSTTIAWNGSIYEPQSDPLEHKFVRYRQPILRDYQLTEYWAIWLEQIGTDFRHPRCTNLSLSDIFVYPDFQKLDVRKSFHPTGIVHDGDVVGFIQEKKNVFIAGAEKTGKTSLAKCLFNDLRESGYVPVFLDKGFALQKASVGASGDRIRDAISAAISKIYTPDGCSRFWQTKIQERAIIIDNFDKLRLGFEGRDELIKWCKRNFEIIIITADPSLRLNDLMNHIEDGGILWSFEHVNILECDHETQYHLIKNWLLSGQDGYQTDMQTLENAAFRYHQIISGIIGNGAIPSLPLFILMMVQQLESRGSIESSNGLYGSLYEMIIKDVLIDPSRDASDIEVKINYLSVYAFALYSAKVSYFDNLQFKGWNRSYCDLYNLSINPEDMVLVLQGIGVFRNSDTDIGFKYKYYHCYFLARYLSDNIFNEDVFKGFLSTGSG